MISDTAHASRLRRRAGAVGADLQHYWGKRGYSLLAQVAIAEVAGDTAAIRRTQQTSTFMASGRYRDFNEYRAPRTTDALLYGRDVGTLTATHDPTGRITHYRVDPDGAGPALPFTVANRDFNVRSLRGTAVMRWEYRPGSTLFFVWTQQRSGSDVLGDFDFDRDRRALLRDRP